MDKIGLLTKILFAVENIDGGRKGFATDGQEHQGRFFFESGISRALTAFREAQASADCEIIILSEQVFLQQELQFCGTADIITRNSLTQAIQSFEDALRSLK
ncbi:MAG: hypothetical protein LBQ67_01570 [Treponema sp.]|nr:hypothetical protein [Treponema sp.]